MKRATLSKRKKAAPPTAPLPLKVTAIVLTQAERTLLSQLAQDQSDLLERAISRSAVIRGLLRLANGKIEPLELRDAIEIEIRAGRKWGHDSVKPPV